MDKNLICPVCGKNNQCQVKTDPDNCWCQGSKPDYARLRQTLGDNKSQCLCPACMTLFDNAAEHK